MREFGTNDINKLQGRGTIHGDREGFPEFYRVILSQDASKSAICQGLFWDLKLKWPNTIIYKISAINYFAIMIVELLLINN